MPAGPTPKRPHPPAAGAHHPSAAGRPRARSTRQLRAGDDPENEGRILGELVCRLLVDRHREQPGFVERDGDIDLRAVRIDDAVLDLCEAPIAESSSKVMVTRRKSESSATG